MKAIISEKGQVTLPKKLRDRMGLRKAQVLDFHEEGGRLVATKVASQDAVDAVYGILHLEGATDEKLAQLRGPVG